VKIKGIKGSIWFMEGRSSDIFIHYNKLSVCTNLSEYFGYVNIFPLDMKDSSLSMELFITKVDNTGDSRLYLLSSFLCP
jgi:hypothetical protein